MPEQTHRPEQYTDQDAEPTANAPDGARPTGPNLAADEASSGAETDADQPQLVRLARALESMDALDRFQEPVHALARALVGEGRRAYILHGTWLGHAVHPLMTDLPIGAWTSSMVLDLVGGRRSRAASRRLIAFGVAAAVPTAITGVAEWAKTSGAERRVGFVHAVGNVAALGLYTASLSARRRERHMRGVTLGLAGGAVASATGFLGGHLTLARKVSSRHPAFRTPSPT